MLFLKLLVISALQKYWQLVGAFLLLSLDRLAAIFTKVVTSIPVQIESFKAIYYEKDCFGKLT
jgi:hypothetical protein